MHGCRCEEAGTPPGLRFVSRTDKRPRLDGQCAGHLVLPCALAFRDRREGDLGDLGRRSRAAQMADRRGLGELKISVVERKARPDDDRETVETLPRCI